MGEIMDGASYPSDRHRTALYLAVEQWGRELDEQPDCGRASLRQRVKAAYKLDLQDGGYGFAIITFLLITVLAAAISWAVERLLSWLYPPLSGGMASVARIERLLCARAA